MGIQENKRFEHFRTWTCDCTWLQFFWPRQLMKNLLNIQSSGDDFSADESALSDEDPLDLLLGQTLNTTTYKPPPIHAVDKGTTYHSKRLMHGMSEELPKLSSSFENLRIHVGTWNIAGQIPPSDLDLSDWLGLQEPADLYVIGFQEIVPLNAANILGTEDDGPAKVWEALIRKTLNSRTHKSSSVVEPLISNQNQKAVWDSNQIYPCGEKLNEAELWIPKVPDMSRGEEEPLLYAEAYNPTPHSGQYIRIASKQMVGLFITIWIRRDLQHTVRNVKVSCVGCGIMGYLGNKGSVAVSLSLYRTSFCFVCAHLASGDREGDELRRNADVMEILRRTCFPRPPKLAKILPETILAHERIIWLGDLNYRLSSSSDETRTLLVKQDWDSLLRNDQLKVQQAAGRVFEGWQEGYIQFAPTYKYVPNSDCYVGTSLQSPDGRRSPAWCDRILWLGKGLSQIAYMRAEYKISDHRPVSATFLTDVETTRYCKLKKCFTSLGWQGPAQSLVSYR